MDQEILSDLGLTPEDVAEADEQVSMVEFGTVHTTEDKQIWYYLQIKPSRYPDYKKAFNARGSVDLKSYGDVLDCGWGDAPPADVVQHMKEAYGCDDSFEEKFIEAIGIEKNN